MFHVLKLTRNLDGFIIKRVPRGTFFHHRYAIDYVKTFANDMLNWKIDFEIVNG